jgi:urea transport system permease protein
MRFLRFLSVLFAILGFAAVPRAEASEAAFAKIAENTYPQIEAGIGELARGDEPTALLVVEAIGEGRLRIAANGALALDDGAGGLIDGRSGQALTGETGRLVPVKVNNRIRRAVETALGSLNLISPIPEKRLAAAQVAFKTHDPASVPALDAALSRETADDVRQALAAARAAAVLFDAARPVEERVAAVGPVAAGGDQDALALLGAASGDAPDALREALTRAAADIEHRLALLSSLRDAWYGLSLGSVLLLAAIGLAITFGVMGIINMAHGEMVMLGAYTAFTVQEVIRAHAPGLFGWSLPIAVPLALLVSGGVGLLIERTVIRFLYGRPLETLLATWGVSLALQQAVRSLYGPTNREVGAPSYMNGAFDLAGVTVTYGRLWIIVFALVVFAGLFAATRFTAFGLRMRAVTQNRSMAAAMGIRTPWVDSMTFALGSGIAGIAGVALSQIDNVSPNLGQGYIIDSFLVVVFGGVGNLWGTLFAAFSLGIVNKFLEPLAGAVLGKILILVFIILFIQKRPRGLFALKGRAVEA